MVRYVSLALTALLVVGCAAHHFEVPAIHPANPAAYEAPLPRQSTTLEGESLDDAATEENAAPIGGHGQHAQPMDASMFQCPMHPDVQQTGPGKCPRCGMALVGKDTRHEHEESGHAH